MRPATLQPAKPQKWTSEAGPRQTKEVDQAFGKIRWEASTYTELSGIKGGEEHRRSYTVICGGGREDCSKALVAIGQQFNWTITRANYKEIIQAVDVALVDLVKNRPVKDQRQSPEEQADIVRKNLEAQQAREKRASAWEDRVSTAVINKRNDFPWVESKRHGESDHAWVGRNIRAELARVYPGTAFSVKTDYGHAYVRWELGPTQHEVKALLGKYEEWTREQDGEETEERIQQRAEHAAVTRLIGGLRYISESRSIPQPIIEAVAKLLCEHKGIEFKGLDQKGLVDGESPGDHLSDWAWRLCHRTSWPSSYAEPVKVEHDDCPDDTYCFWKLIFGNKGVTPMPATVSAGGVQISRNDQHDGVEIRFPSRPAPEVLARIKGAGFRWSMRSHVWYKKYSPQVWELAHSLVGLALPTTAAVEPGPDRFDMAVEDQMARQCGLL
jgi:hypothetical protein